MRSRNEFALEKDAIHACFGEIAAMLDPAGPPPMIPTSKSGTE